MVPTSQPSRGKLVFWALIGAAIWLLVGQLVAFGINIALGIHDYWGLVPVLVMAAATGAATWWLAGKGKSGLICAFAGPAMGGALKHMIRAIASGERIAPATLVVVGVVFGLAGMLGALLISRISRAGTSKGL